MCRWQAGPAVAILVAVAWLAGAAARGAPPNIVVVLVDDMGWGDLSCFGNTGVRTPNIDRLAAEGLRFGRFYVAAPVCSPSRAALTTGQYPHRWRITSFLASRGENKRRGMADWLDPEAPSLARILRGRGYATGHFGKWHQGGQRDVADAPPIAAYGFDESLTNFEGLGAKLLPLTLTPKGEVGRIWADAERLGGPVRWMQRSEITGGFAAAALDFIDAAVRADKPFYVNLWPDDVHTPFWPPVDRWPEKKRDRYLVVLEEMDRQLGRLFDRLRDDPRLRSNTLVLLCSDNGPEAGAGAAGPLRGSKFTLHEGGIRSPLVAWGPGVIAAAAAGRRDDESVVVGIDLAPSLVAIAGAAVPPGVVFDGENVADALRGRPRGRRDAPVCWRRPPDGRLRGAVAGPDLAVIDGAWKLVCGYDGTTPALFDVVADPGERENLAARHPDVTTRLTRHVVAWHGSMPPDEGAVLLPAR